MVVIDRY